MSFLSKVGDALRRDISRSVAQVNPLDNGRTFKHNAPTNKRSVAGQVTHNAVTNVAGGFVKAPIQFANTGNLAAHNVYDTVRMMAANATHNPAAFTHANQAAQSTYNKFAAPNSGLFHQGTFLKDANQAQHGSARDIATRVGGGTLQTAATVAPFAKGGSFALKGLTAKQIVPRLALEGGAYNGAFNAGQQLQNTGHINPKELATNIGIGAAAGPALYGAGKYAPAAIKGIAKAPVAASRGVIATGKGIANVLDAKPITSGKPKEFLTYQDHPDVKPHFNAVQNVLKSGEKLRANNATSKELKDNAYALAQAQSAYRNAVNRVKKISGSVGRQKSVNPDEAKRLGLNPEDTGANPQGTPSPGNTAASPVLDNAPANDGNGHINPSSTGSIAPGTRVRASDRGNVGTVVTTNTDGSHQVRFVNRKDKTTYTKTMQPSEVSPIGSKGARQTQNRPAMNHQYRLDSNGQLVVDPPEVASTPPQSAGQSGAHFGQSDAPTMSQPQVGRGRVETKQDSTALKQRAFIQTVLDDPNTAPEVKQSISSLYSARNTHDAQIKAANLVRDHRDIAEQIASNPVDDTGVFVGNELISQLQREGNHARAIELVNRQAEALTGSGRMSQAASAYGKLTPPGILRFAQNELDKYNLSNNLRSDKQLKLTAEQSKDLAERAATIQQMPEGRTKDIAIKEMMKEVYTLVPSTWVQKVSTLQTIAQLLNPKTSVRNILGNAIFGTAEAASQTVAAGIDKAVSAILGTERTTALPNLKVQYRGAIRGGKEAYQEATRGINLGPSTQFELNDVPAFRGKLLGSLEKAMGVTLRVPDRAAYQAAFDDTVVGLMKANHLDAPTQGILEQAHANGVYRTFQDNSRAAQVFTGIKGALNHVGFEKDGKRFGLGDLILKYPKTPGNIIARGIDYTPISILKSFKAITDTVFSGKPFDQHTFVNSLARGGISGTAIVGAGAVLGSLGIITDKPSTDTDTRNLQKQTGLGGYQINTSALRRYVASGFDPNKAKIQKGDTLVSYDWAQPLSIPLSAGAAIGSKQSAKDGLTSTLTTASEGVNTLVEQPMVSSLNTFFGNIKDKGAVGALGQTLISAPASFIPTASNQVRQLTDNTTRSTYDPNPAVQSLNMVKNRLPFADRSLPAAVDTLGNDKQNYQNGSNNPFNVLVNPAFVTKYQPSDSAQLPLDIYNTSGNMQQMPRTVKTTQKINGQNVHITAQQNHDYQQYVGQMTASINQILSKDKSFTSLPQDEQANKMATILTDINSAAKVKILGNNPANLTKSAQSIIDGNLPMYTTQKTTTKASSGTKATVMLASATDIKKAGQTTTIDGQMYHYTATGKRVKGAPPTPKAPSTGTTTYDPKTGTWTKVTPTTGKTVRIDSTGAQTVLTPGIGRISNARPDYQTNILSAAKKYNVDPYAAMSVAAMEGLGGGVGDNGTSFGPFQMHVGGALPPGKDQAWAESPEGIDYAMQQISKVAGGKQGEEAIHAIVRQFERPLNPDNEVAGAIAIYGGKSAKLSGGSTRTVKLASSSSGGRSSSGSGSRKASSGKIAAVKMPAIKTFKLPKVSTSDAPKYRVAKATQQKRTGKIAKAKSISVKYS